ncbi:MAG: hypothetical protein LBK12_00045 [Odoribacteraceae bacterium]|jgi:hypothetical protein|nr:hypothetical protein [Odoribacteraceae bacterium]
MKTNVLILITFFLALALCSAGQEKRIQRINFEVDFGIIFGATRDGAEKLPLGGTMGMEIRYNLRSLPLNIGLIQELSGFSRVYETGRKENIRSLKTLGVCDYNFRRGKAVSMFVGAATGGAIEMNMLSSKRRTLFAFVPRVGLRFFKHVSLSLDYAMTRVYHNHFDLKLGVYI